MLEVGWTQLEICDWLLEAYLQLLGVCKYLLDVDLVPFTGSPTIGGTLVVIHMHGSWPAAATTPVTWPCCWPTRQVTTN